MSVIQQGYAAFAGMQEIMNAINTLQATVALLQGSVNELKNSAAMLDLKLSSQHFEARKCSERLQKDLAARVSASSHNTMARMQNSRLQGYDGQLVPLCDAASNEELNDFPNTARILDENFSKDDLKALLCALEMVDTEEDMIEHDDGNEDKGWERLRQRARLAIGLTAIL